MIKALTAFTAAGAIAAAVVAVPSKAEAYPVWVIPAIVGGVLGGVALGAAAQANANYAYGPGWNTQRSAYVQPGAATNCHLVRERTARGGWRRIEVCD